LITAGIISACSPVIDAYRLSAKDVLAIAKTAGIVAGDGTINLIEYTAYLSKEVAGGAD
jgi:hypothetical protein